MIFSASTCSSAILSAPVRLAILADIPSMSENRKRLSRKIPVMPAILLQTPMILMRCAALSIGPRIVTYGFEAVCNSASPVPCRNSPSRNSA